MTPPSSRQRNLFLVASGMSTAGSFAGLTAKGWILMDATGDPLVLALHFATLSLPSLLLSGPAGVLTDRLGSEAVLVRAQWGLLGSALLGALAIPLLSGVAQVALLLLSTLLMGVASTYELTARSKYSALLVDRPEQLASYLTAFSVVFNVGKLVGPPLGGWLVALTGPGPALAIDAATYLLPIAAVRWLLHPRRGAEERSAGSTGTSLGTAWRDSGPVLRHLLRFTALSCLVGFFHPALAPMIADLVLGPSPQELGVFTSVLAAGSICGGLLLQRTSHWITRRPALLLGWCTVITALAQLGMARAGSGAGGLAMAFLMGGGTACLLAGMNLLAQVGSPMVLRGRMAALAQIAFLGGGGLSGLVAGALAGRLGLPATFLMLGGAGLALGLLELGRNRRMALSLR
ncbi:MAG: MFS transporter [Synechococcaceae cyanobacterium]|nr:MFS transporter [Synechococcaceae cyanobacterium]